MTPDDGRSNRDVAPGWEPYPPVPGVVGTLLRSTESVAGPLGRRRLLVHLPTSARLTPRRRYPVIYAQDGDNLFDPAASYSGEWRFDETMEALARDGIEAIVVGIPSAGCSRIDEYGPWRHFGQGGSGGRYLDFIVESVKPTIDASFPTMSDRAHTGILGSSMGAIISLFAYVERPAVFGFACAMSPAFLYAPAASMSWLRSTEIPSGRVYLDVGTNEFPDDEESSRAYLEDARTASAIFGSVLGSGLRYTEEAGATHDESAWARRLPTALRFLLAED